MNKNRKHNDEAIGEILDEFLPIYGKKITARLSIANKIEEARQSKHWSKKELANQLSQRPSVITKWLSGSHNFTVDTLIDIELKLDIKILNIEESMTQAVVQNVRVAEGIDSLDSIWHQLVDDSFPESRDFTPWKPGKQLQRA